MSTIPTLTEQNIRTFVGEQNFQKGQQLVHDAAIVDLVRPGIFHLNSSRIRLLKKSTWWHNGFALGTGPGG